MFTCMPIHTNTRVHTHTHTVRGREKGKKGMEEERQREGESTETRELRSEKTNWERQTLREWESNVCIALSGDSKLFLSPMLLPACGSLRILFWCRYPRPEAPFILSRFDKQKHLCSVTGPPGTTSLDATWKSSQLNYLAYLGLLNPRCPFYVAVLTSPNTWMQQ